MARDGPAFLATAMQPTSRLLRRRAVVSLAPHATELLYGSRSGNYL